MSIFENKRVFEETPRCELDYRIEAKDHLVKVNDWLKQTGLDEKWKAITPEPNQLFIDYDISVGDYFDDKVPGDELPYGVCLPEAYSSAYCTLAEAYPEAVIQQRFTMSKSGKQHLVVTVTGVEFNKFERIAWQTAFGSDPKREALHIKSTLMGSLNPNILIERK